MWALVDEYHQVCFRFLKAKANVKLRFQLDFNELSDQFESQDSAQSIHYHSVGMIIALKLHSSFEVSIR